MLRSKLLFTIPLLAVVVAVSPHVSHAGLITVAGVTASSEIAGGGRPPARLIDGSGLTGTDHDLSTLNQWLSSAGGNPAWGGNDADPWVIFDLGAIYIVDSMEVWNFSEATWSVARGVNGVSVEYGSTTATMATGVIDGSSTVPGITNLTIAPATSPTITGTTYALGGIKARYIKIDITPGSGIGNHGGDNNFYGMNEVQFDGTMGSEPFAITEIQYDPDADPNPTVTLTWTSRPGETFIVSYSGDMTNWGGELENEVEAEEIIDHCARNLAPYKVPRRIEFCETL